MVVIFPTDTVYGIGTPIFDIDGINKIYEIKHRPKERLLACLCADLKQIEEISYVTDDAKKLINKFLPGPLTLILEPKEIVKQKIGYSTIGIRIPNSKIAISLLHQYGPMLTTSVNESGEEPINDYKTLCKIYGSLVDKVYDLEEPLSKISSTVVRIAKEIEILREGEISKEDILSALS